MATSTPTLQLRKPDPLDNVVVQTDLNDNYDKLDSAVTSLQSRVLALEKRGMVYKQVAESMVAPGSDVPHNDQELFFNVTAGKFYYISMLLRVSQVGSLDTADFRYCFTHPAGGGILVTGNLSPAVANTGTSGPIESISRTNTTSPSTNILVGTINSAAVSVQAQLSYKCVNNGVFRLQWAQAVASPSMLHTVDVGSFLKWEEYGAAA